MMANEDYREQPERILNDDNSVTIIIYKRQPKQTN